MIKGFILACVLFFGFLVVAGSAAQLQPAISAPVAPQTALQGGSVQLQPAIYVK